jgi:hypothetical protein
VDTRRLTKENTAKSSKTKVICQVSQALQTRLIVKRYLSLKRRRLPFEYDNEITLLTSVEEFIIKRFLQKFYITFTFSVIIFTLFTYLKRGVGAHPTALSDLVFSFISFSMFNYWGGKNLPQAFVS